MKTIAPTSDFEYYLGNIYWNDFDAVNSHINHSISSDSSVDWQQHLVNKYGMFDNALFLNCGNGWVERECFNKGLIKRATAFDFSEQMIIEARQNAVKLNLDINYIIADCNKFIPDPNAFDLVINHAAMHHVAYINKLTLNIARGLKNSQSIYAGFDYIGPHRNQYPWPMWAKIIEVNNRLPKKYQLELTYPHFKTMLATDPTEAIHSELQVETLKRYFEFKEYVPLGGAVAYTLLNQNNRLYQEQHTAEGQNVIEKILNEDRLFCQEFPNLNLFAFWTASPKHSSDQSNENALAFQAVEDFRESCSEANGHRYYEPLELEIIYDNFDQKLRSQICEVERGWKNNYDSLLKSQKSILNVKSWPLYSFLKRIYFKFLYKN